MKKILVVVGIVVVVVLGCADRVHHRYHRPCTAAPWDKKDQANGTTMKMIDEFDLDRQGTAAPSPQAAAPQATAQAAPADMRFRIVASQVAPNSYTHKDGRTVSSGCAECHETVGKHCRGCNKIPPSVEYCTRCH